MIDLSEEQRAIVEAEAEALSVIACAGSGKTRTAVHRLITVRRQLGHSRGRVALLSFSNVAVETFRKSFASLRAITPDLPSSDLIEIDTVDGFITSNILKPHAHRVMCATRQAFLVNGTEAFLSSFTLPPPSKGKMPITIAQLRTGFRQSKFYFYTEFFDNKTIVDTQQALALITRLGRTGAYTHDLGRYWGYRALKSEPGLMRAFAHRFPRILVDEAQDIGTTQQAILDLLSTAGSKITLIGDPNQAIYEYAGADGAYLKGHAARIGAKPLELTWNYRSIPAITAVANAMLGRKDKTDREHRDAPYGAFIVPYAEDGEEQLATDFEQAVTAAKLDIANSAILCRAAKLVDSLSAVSAPIGAGSVRNFAAAAVCRDKHGDYQSAFRLVISAVESLLKDPPQGLAVELAATGRHSEMLPVRRLLWAFTRRSDSGLPPATLQADTAWHKALKTRVTSLLTAIEAELGLEASENLGQRLSTRSLPAAPIWAPTAVPKRRLRVDTVHQAKGESLDGVLYIAAKSNLTALLSVAASEVGRIGYVALTRATDLLWLGVPEVCFSEFRPALLALGFSEIRPAQTKNIVS